METIQVKEKDFNNLLIIANMLKELMLKDVNLLSQEERFFVIRTIDANE